MEFVESTPSTLSENLGHIKIVTILAMLERSYIDADGKLWLVLSKRTRLQDAARAVKELRGVDVELTLRELG